MERDSVSLFVAMHLLNGYLIEACAAKGIRPNQIPCALVESVYPILPELSISVIF